MAPALQRDHKCETVQTLITADLDEGNMRIVQAASIATVVLLGFWPTLTLSAPPPPPTPLPPLPPTPEDSGYTAYYVKPDFKPSGDPSEGNNARRFDISTGSGPNGDITGEYVAGVLPPGAYKVSIHAKASAPGATLRIGVSDKFISAPLQLSTKWKEYSQIVGVTEPSDRRGEWFREGNIRGGWIDIAGFSITPAGDEISKAPDLPQFPDDDAFQGYYSKPAFVPVDTPNGVGRRFSISTGSGDSKDISGVWFTGVVGPGHYQVSLYARSSDTGPTLHLGLSDKYLSAGLPLSTHWHKFSVNLVVTEPTDRAGEWYRQGNVPGGWIDVADFSVVKTK